ncbi:protein mono-ADP-ribosyltransferase PARP14-like [Lissotriton helveticus]
MGDEAYPYPVLVRGDWGSQGCTKALKNKLLCYFQSQKKSGGGECQITVSRPGEVRVHFAELEVRERVLANKVHTIDMPEKRKLSLDVQLLETEEHCGVKHHRTRDVPEGDPEPMSTDEPQEPDSATSGEHITEESDSILVIDSGAKIDEDVLEMYFENTKRSGGGPIKQLRCDRKGIQITFENIEDAKNVLSRRHSVQNLLLQVQPCLGPSVVKEQPPTPAPPSSSSSVVLENVPETMNREMLTMLVENTSGLDEKDFKLEHISERKVAVVTFRTSESAMGFMQMCTQSARVKSHGITARLLECTKSIKVEDLPPDVCTEFLSIYFESSKHGGGRVADVQSLPEEDSAIVTFFDQKVITTVLAEPHMMKGKAVSVYPYYLTLDSALYGKERPVMKLPELIRLPISPYIWHYLQKDEKSLQDLKNEMSASYCELTWPDSGTPCTEVILVPDASLSKQRMILFKVAKTWDEEVPKKFSSIMEKFKVIEHSVDREMWEVMKEKVTSAVGVEVVIIPDVSSNKVGLAGILENVVQMDLRFKEILQQTTKETERKAQSICEHLRVSPSEYAILCCDKLEEDIHKIFPEMEMAFEVSTSRIKFLGLPLEVVVAKSKILEWERTLKQKTLNVNPYVLRFIQQVDNDDLSYILLTDKTINAFCKTESTMVLLKGNSQKAIEEAEKQIKESIIYKWVDLEDSSVIKMKEWHTLRSSLLETFNSERPAVLIEIEENKVVISGYSVAVTEVYHQVSNFIDENTQIKKSIPLGYEVVAQFLQEEKKQMLLEIQKKNIKIDLNPQTMKRHLLLSGPRRDVQVMAGVVQQVLSSLHSKVLSINKPGAKKFSQKSEETWFITLKQKYNCYVRLAKNQEECEEYSEVETGLPSYHVNLQGGIVVGVYKDDLPKHPVDVVVNASNEDLKHIGGVAQALLQAAGPQLQTESDNIVERQGKLKPGAVAITLAGNLPCKQVIHAVGPRWHEFAPATAESLLKRCIKESLELAELYNHKSIGIPAISSGIFGFPLDLCVNCIVISLKEHMEARNWKSCLSHIHFVDKRQKTVDAFTCALKKHFGGGQQSQPVPRLASLTKPEKRKPRNQQDVQVVQTEEGLAIILEQGNIQDATTDVIVNSVAKDLNLDGGAVSKALLQKAGPQLQQLVDAAAKRDNVDVGSVLPTDGCNLNCKNIFHVICPGWKNTQSSEELRDLIKECLKRTESKHFKSITFPAIGTGNLGFPKPIVAASMFAQVIKSSKKKNFRNLQEVHFMLHPTDTDNITAFSDELEKRFGGKVEYKKRTLEVTADVSANTSASQSSASIGLVTVPTLGVYEMLIGTVKLQVKSGDITKETTDVIVNSTNQTFNLKQGVSKAILDAAGQIVEQECAQKAALPNNGYITTTNGSLACKNIVHVVGQTDLQQIKTIVNNVLQECEQRQLTSVAFPALGTGQGGVNPSLVADAMIDALVDFASQKNASSVKNIAIIIFQTQMLETFHTSMKNKQGTRLPEQKSLISKLASATVAFFSNKRPAEKRNTSSFVFEDKIEPAVFQICGENSKNVDDTASWIEELIKNEYCDNTINDEWIAEFEEKEHQKMTELQNSLQIRIQVKCKQDNASIQVSGLTRDVMTACMEIQNMIKKISKEAGQKRQAELVSNIVEWQYDNGRAFVAFHKQANLQLEKAYTENEGTVKIQNGNRTYHVNFAAESATDDSNKKVRIKRTSKIEGENDIPVHWESVSANSLNLVPLLPQTNEYKDVEALFKKTCTHTIQKIERVQNVYLWKNYTIKKMSIDEKNGSQNNEKRLFHGTAQADLNKIHTHGFNRSYAGKNAAAIGNGTYFAVNANYSAQNTYSRPDATGMKYMYLTRVLTGLFCTGGHGILTPPAKSTKDPTDLYDSVTDNVANPSMFVIFNDVQAYPEYLISFK